MKSYTYLKPKSKKEIKDSMKLFKQQIKESTVKELFDGWLSTNNFTTERMWEKELKLRTETEDKVSKEEAISMLQLIGLINGEITGKSKYNMNNTVQYE